MLEYNYIVIALVFSVEPANPDVSEGKPPGAQPAHPRCPRTTPLPLSEGNRRWGNQRTDTRRPEPGFWGPREEVRDPVHPSVGPSASRDTPAEGAHGPRSQRDGGWCGSSSPWPGPRAPHRPTQMAAKAQEGP